MKRTFFAFILLLVCGFTGKPDFLSEQKKHATVATAFSEKEQLVHNNLRKNGLDFKGFQLLFIAFKSEKVLEVYARNHSGTIYKKVSSYPICVLSGDLGPKQMRGDGQIPEGFYHIDRFHPASNFYLSLGINYPNLADRRRSTASNLGGDIFIHGNCKSIGCLAMTDDKIKEIYVYAAQARQNGQQKIPVYIFPFKMTDRTMQAAQLAYQDYPDLIRFWANLKTGYDRFETLKTELKVTVRDSGNYDF